LEALIWTVRAAARFVPRATCLTQVLAAQILLARRGVEATPGEIETAAATASSARQAGDTRPGSGQIDARPASDGSQPIR